MFTVVFLMPSTMSEILGMLITYLLNKRMNKENNVERYRKEHNMVSVHRDTVYRKKKHKLKLTKIFLKE